MLRESVPSQSEFGNKCVGEKALSQSISEIKVLRESVPSQSKFGNKCVGEKALSQIISEVKAL